VASMRRGHIQTRYQRACQCCVEHGVTGKMTMFQRFLIVQCSFLFAFVLDPARRRAWGPKVLAFELMPAMSGGPSAEGRGASRLQVRRQWGAHDATGASLPSADVTEFQNMVSDHRGTEIVKHSPEGDRASVAAAKIGDAARLGRHVIASVVGTRARSAERRVSASGRLSRGGPTRHRGRPSVVPGLQASARERTGQARTLWRAGRMKQMIRELKRQVAGEKLELEQLKGLIRAGLRLPEW
jgi:hypothetical protein